MKSGSQQHDLSPPAHNALGGQEGMKAEEDSRANVEAWTVEEVCAWVLHEVGHQGEAIAAVLKAEEISGAVLSS